MSAKNFPSQGYRLVNDSGLVTPSYRRSYMISICTLTQKYLLRRDSIRMTSELSYQNPIHAQNALYISSKQISLNHVA